jgi:hypothetical protein
VEQVPEQAVVDVVVDGEPLDENMYLVLVPAVGTVTVTVAPALTVTLVVVPVGEQVILDGLGVPEEAVTEKELEDGAPGSATVHRIGINTAVLRVVDPVEGPCSESPPYETDIWNVEDAEGVNATEQSATVLLTSASTHWVEVGLIPDVGLVVNVKSPIGGSESAHPSVGEPVVWPYGSVQVTVPVHVLEEPRRTGLGEQDTVRLVGSVSNIEEKGSRELYIVPDVVDPRV